MSDWLAGPRYYDRAGEPITMEVWALSREANLRVAEDQVGPLYVSTIWLGLDHRFGDGPPLIFETMIFGPWEWHDLYVRRYSTEGEALIGHAAAVMYARRRRHGLVKHARDVRRSAMKSAVKAMGREDEISRMWVRMYLGDRRRRNARHG